MSDTMPQARVSTFSSTQQRDDDDDEPDATNNPLVATFFTSSSATTKREIRLSLAALAQLIDTTSAPSKEELPWLKLARFGDTRTEKGSLRHNANLVSITGIEADYDRGEMSLAEAKDISARADITAIIYSSPSYTADKPKWRVLCPLSQKYPPADRDRFLARLNGLFGGIFAPESWPLSQGFYFGSVNGNPAHRVVVIEGTPIDLADHLDADAIWPALREAQTKLREARSARASDDHPRDGDHGSLIEQIRARLDIGQVLAAHGYARRGNDYRHPASTSGSYGLNVATFGGIERVYSHNGNDPLAPGNLPAWTGGVSAIDVVDVAIILDYSGDRPRGLRELAVRFGLADKTSRQAPFLRLWEASSALPGTVAAVYLETLGLGHLIGCPELRFCATCPHPNGPRLPALVAAVRAIDGSLTGVLRTYLAADGASLAVVKPPRAVLGAVMGGAIRLSPIVLPPEIKRVVLANVGTNGAPRDAWRRLKREQRVVRQATPNHGAATFSEVVKHKKTSGAFA
jgi:hypothetical protein